jgi:SAM-dependent methyltransferase
MQPDVVCRAESLPFEDARFDAVSCRVAAHHFDHVDTAVREMARVSADRVILVDNLFLDDDAEEADRIRDPSHVRNLSEAEWLEICGSSRLHVDETRRFDKAIEVDPWLERARCHGDDAACVRELLGTRIANGWLTLDRIAILAGVR